MQYPNWLMIRPKRTTSVGWKKEERQQSPKNGKHLEDQKKGTKHSDTRKTCSKHALLGCAYHVTIGWKLQEFHDSVSPYVETCGETATLQQDLLHLAHACTHQRSHRNSRGFQDISSISSVIHDIDISNYRSSML